MKIRKLALAWCMAGLLLAVGFTARADDIKKISPTGYVTDLAGILTPQAKAQLEALGAELEQKTGAQMAVVTVKSLDGQDVQTYANDLFQHLGVGKKKEDNGFLLLVAPNDRKYWTEVGYGLEPVINDARAGDAGRLMVPYFRQGNYSAGVTAAARQLANDVAESEGVTLSGAPQVRREPRSNSRGRGLPFWILLLIIFLVLRSFGGGGRGPGVGTGLLIGSILGSMSRGGRGGWGSGSGGGGWGGSGGGFGGFGGGSSGGGGAGGSW